MDDKQLRPEDFDGFRSLTKAQQEQVVRYYESLSPEEKKNWAEMPQNDQKENVRYNDLFGWG